MRTSVRSDVPVRRNGVSHQGKGDCVPHWMVETSAGGGADMIVDKLEDIASAPVLGKGSRRSSEPDQHTGIAFSTSRRPKSPGRPETHQRHWASLCRALLFRRGFRSKGDVDGRWYSNDARVGSRKSPRASCPDNMHHALECTSFPAQRSKTPSETKRPIIAAGPRDSRCD